ncbi:unnamed protein product [Oikopleura dioica]|nr:unnamed protein product [Oikopleura dioica]
MIFAPLFILKSYLPEPIDVSFSSLIPKGQKAEQSSQAQEFKLIGEGASSMVFSLHPHLTHHMCVNLPSMSLPPVSVNLGLISALTDTHVNIQAEELTADDSPWPMRNSENDAEQNQRFTNDCLSVNLSPRWQCLPCILVTLTPSLVLFNSLPFTLLICRGDVDAFQIPSLEAEYTSNLGLFKFGLQLAENNVVFAKRSLKLVDHIRPQWADEADQPLEIPLFGTVTFRMKISDEHFLDVVLHSTCSHGFQRIFIESSLYIENYFSEPLRFGFGNSKNIIVNSFDEHKTDAFRSCIPDQTNKAINLLLRDDVVEISSAFGEKSQPILIRNPPFCQENWALVELYKENNHQRMMRIFPMIKVRPRYLIRNDTPFEMTIVDVGSRTKTDILIPAKSEIFYQPASSTNSSLGQLVEPKIKLTCLGKEQILPLALGKYGLITPDASLNVSIEGRSRSQRRISITVFHEKKDEVKLAKIERRLKLNLTLTVYQSTCQAKRRFFQLRFQN